MGKTFHSLFRVRWYHDFFADGVARGIQVAPTPITKKMMKNLDLRLVKNQRGFEVYYGSKEQKDRDGKIVRKATINEAAQPLLFTFLLFFDPLSEKNTFTNYTRLPVGVKKNQKYYFSNINREVEKQENSVILTQEKMVGEKDLKTFKAMKLTPELPPAESVSVAVENAVGKTIFRESLRQEFPSVIPYLLNLSGEDWGLYQLLIKPEGGAIATQVEETCFLMPDPFQTAIWGIVQIAAYSSFDDSILPTQKNIPEYELNFQRRAIAWRYHIVNKSRLKFDHLNLIENKQSRAFIGPENGTLVDGTSKQTIIIGKPDKPSIMDLQEKQPEKFQLQLMQTQPNGTPNAKSTQKESVLYTIDLPQPDLKRLKVERSRQGLLFYSDIYVYL